MADAPMHDLRAEFLACRWNGKKLHQGGWVVWLEEASGGCVPGRGETPFAEPLSDHYAQKETLPELIGKFRDQRSGSAEG
jgi:hypothetical protein